MHCMVTTCARFCLLIHLDPHGQLTRFYFYNFAAALPRPPPLYGASLMYIAGRKSSIRMYGKLSKQFQFK